MKTWKIQHLLYSDLQSWQYLFVLRFADDSIKPAANATTTTTTNMFTIAANFQGQFNHYSNSDFYQDIRNLKRQYFLCSRYTSPTAHFWTEELDF